MKLLSRFNDTTTATPTTVIDWTEVCIIFQAHSFHRIQVRIIVEGNNHRPKVRVTDNKRSIVLRDAVLLQYKDTVSV